MPTTERQGKAPVHHRRLPQHECAGHQPGHVGQYQPAPRRGPADHADQRAVRGDAARADRLHGSRRLARSRPAPVERVAVSPRYPQGPARGQCRGPRPPALLDDPRHHGPGDSAGPLHDRVRRRRHHPLRALRDVRHAGTFRACRARARRQVGLPAGTSRHDRGRAFAVEGDVACGRGRNAGAAVSRLPADRHAATAAEGGDRRTFSAGSPDTVLPRNSGVTSGLTSPRSPLRSSARR